MDQWRRNVLSIKTTIDDLYRIGEFEQIARLAVCHNRAVRLHAKDALNDAEDRIAVLGLTKRIASILQPEKRPEPVLDWYARRTPEVAL